MSVKLEKKRTDPLGCHVPSVLRQMKNTNFAYIEIPWWFLSFSYRQRR